MKRAVVLPGVVALSILLAGCESDKPSPRIEPAPNVKPSITAGPTDPEKAVKQEPIPGPAVLPEKEIPEPERLTPQVDLDQLATVVQGNTDFALELYDLLAKREGNLFFSPGSISTALAMTYAGAEGNTRTQMKQALHFPFDGESLHVCFEALLKSLGEGGEGYELNIANRLWGQQDFQFRESFLALNRQSYGAELAEVDFAKNTEGARKTINDWVADRTKDKILDLLKPSVLSPNTLLVLTNAIYFKGDWASQFKEQSTRRAPFFVSAEQPVDVSMMHQFQEFKYRRDNQVQILEMPYEGEALSMVVVLPAERDGLPALEQSLSSEKLQQWFFTMGKRKVEVYLPKFKIEAEFTLNDALKALGMTDAFDERADFSGMVEDAPPGMEQEHLFISKVVHKAYVDVNEEGTEAAAATGVVMDRLTTSAPQPPPVFRADHPFLFLIRDSRTGSILFLGRVENPV